MSTAFIQVQEFETLEKATTSWSFTKFFTGNAKAIFYFIWKWTYGFLIRALTRGDVFQGGKKNLVLAKSLMIVDGELKWVETPDDCTRTLVYLSKSTGKSGLEVETKNSSALAITIE